MNRINYQKELDLLISKYEKMQTKPKLLLHACCAPCSSYCMEYLCNFFDLSILFYNPNIDDETEYFKRKNEEIRLISELNKNSGINIKFIDIQYNCLEFLDKIRGYETEPEGGKRCRQCFRLRMAKTAEIAKQFKFDYFTTSLTISPLKNAILLNTIGEECGQLYGVAFLPSDFKKKNGYKRSIELSEKYGLYRQNYCGCSFSKQGVCKD